MSLKFITEQILSDTADAIRAKTGGTAAITPADFPTEIANIPSGGGMDEKLAALMTGTANGEIVIDNIESLKMTRFVFGRDPGLNPVEILRFPDLTTWTFGNYSGGIVSNNTSANRASESPTLRILDLPKCRDLYIGLVNNATNRLTFGNLETLNAPELINLYGSIRAIAATELRFKKLTNLMAQCQYCPSLELFDFNGTSVLPTQCWRGCTNLKALVIRASNVPYIYAADILQGTAIEAGTGYIYVPRAMISAYEAATNWTVYTGRFRALEDYTSDGTLTGDFVMPAN